MPQSYVNFAGVERVDLVDMLQVAQRTPADAQQEVLANVFLPPQSFSIVSGFRPYAKDANTVAVGQQGKRNVAMLGTREGGIIHYAVLSASGPETQAISISNYPSGNFGIYVRATLQPGQSQQRIFWDDAQLQEVAQLTPTQLLMSWEILIQAAVPSGEWYQLGTAIVTAQGGGAGSTVTVADSRRLLFEGVVGQQTYQTWGSATDRTTDRGTSGITDLQTKLDALRTCIQDIKGRNLVPWYSPYIGGLNVGTRFAVDETPGAERVAIGDSGFALQGSINASSIYLNGSASQLFLNRSSNQLTCYLGGQNAFNFIAGGYAAMGRVPNLISPVQPLTVWNYAPYGRVAQFTADQTYPASISIGDTGNQGGRVDFARGSISDFQASFWSIRGDFAAQPTFSILGINGVVLTSQMLGSSGAYTTWLYGQTLNLSGTTTLNLYAGSGSIQAQQRFYANYAFYNQGRYADPGAMVWLAFNYLQGPNTYKTVGLPTISLNATQSTDGYADVDFNQPIPANAVIQISAPRRNGVNMNIGYEVQNNRYRLHVVAYDTQGNTGYFDYNVTILIGQ